MMKHRDSVIDQVSQEASAVSSTQNEFQLQLEQNNMQLELARHKLKEVETVNEKFMEDVARSDQIAQTAKKQMKTATERNRQLSDELEKSKSELAKSKEVEKILRNKLTKKTENIKRTSFTSSISSIITKTPPPSPSVVEMSNATVPKSRTEDDLMDEIEILTSTKARLEGILQRMGDEKFDLEAKLSQSQEEIDILKGTIDALHETTQMMLKERSEEAQILEQNKRLIRGLEQRLEEQQLGNHSIEPLSSLGEFSTKYDNVSLVEKSETEIPDGILPWWRRVFCCST
eukprot:TRINITY_DN1863_c0_g1_i3.p1 TRINITY_DN1863_c0_g1~~TRINITY_DN1863_c0_g1_i3.p1  ORF type:complete len:288 (+),score=97.81 TRINITY_DN1863_c0_g1_i3:283-1146(+)